MRKDSILVTGANGQIGTVLTRSLREHYGSDQVLATDINSPLADEGPFAILDILDRKRLAELVDTYQITQIYHLVAILSAKGESNPMLTWKINMDSLFNVLECAREKKLHKVFFPSSIAAFGDLTPKKNTPQFTVLHPGSIYGISKAAAENWCQYYFKKYGLDIRSLRYPGIISHQSPPGGGTTDYAVDIFHKALDGVPYECFLKENTRLPMIYMPDAIQAVLRLMEAPAEKISVRTSYNLAAMDFTPKELYQEILKHIPDFEIYYKPDFRQEIAESWSESVDDSFARKDWQWKEAFDLASMTRDMIYNLKKKQLKNKPEIIGDFN